MDPSTTLTLITFEDGGEYHALIHELTDQNPTPSGSGGTAEEARADLYEAVKGLRGALELIEPPAPRASTALDNTLLSGKSSSETEQVTLGELYDRAS